MKAVALATLTESQTAVFILLLGFVLLLLVVGVLNTLRRVNELEKVVYKSTEKTAELHEAVDSVHEAQETG